MSDESTELHCPRPDQHEPHSWDPDEFDFPGPYWCNGERL